MEHQQLRRAAATTDQTISAASASPGPLHGELSVGVIPTVTALDVPSLLARYRAAHPEVRVRLRTGSSAALIADIAAGLVDAAILGLPETPPAGISARVLRRENLVAVVGSEHPLADHARLSLDELAPETFVDFPSGSAGRAQSDLAFAGTKLRREVAFEALTVDMFLALVREGLAVALLPPAVVPDVPELRAIPVAGAPVRTEYLAWRDAGPTPEALAFLALVDES